MQSVIQVIRADGGADESLDLGLSSDQLLNLYRTMVLTRTLDTKMVSLQRQGRISFYLSSFGEEACSVGSAMALGKEDWLFPAYREQGAALLRGVTLRSIIAHLRGSAEDEHKGRSLPGIFGNRGANFVVPSAPVGTQLPHAVGAAIAAQLLGDKIVTIAYFGDGATSSNDFHSGLNFAGVFRAPTIFFCKNNQWAISTPVERQTASEGIAVKAEAYGFEGIRVDGNDVLAVYLATKSAVEKARSGGGPTLIEALTYRLSPHSTSDEPSKYRNELEYTEWVKRDPISRLRSYLRSTGIWDSRLEQGVQEEADRSVNEAIKQAEAVPRAPLESLITDVYAELPKSLLEQFKDLRSSL